MRPAPPERIVEIEPNGVVSSVRVNATGPEHERVDIFNRGALAGAVVVKGGDGAEFVKRLRFDRMRVLAGVQAALAPLVMIEDGATPEDAAVDARRVLEALERELVEAEGA